MPLDLSLIRGGGLDLSSVASSIASANQAASAAAGISAGAYSDASRMLAQGFQLAQERKQRELAAEQERKFAREQQAAGFAENAASQQRAQDFEAEKQRLQRASRAQEFETSLREGRLQAGQEMLRGLGQAAIGAGAQPGPLMELLLQMQGDTYQSNPPQLPGVPGGFMQEGFQKLMPERGRLGNIPMIPPPPSEGDKGRADKDEQARIRAELDGYTMSPKGRKETMLEVTRTPAQVYGLEGLMPKALESRVQRLWPWTVPVKVQGALGEPATEDRSALDEQLKWLDTPFTEFVPSGPAMAGLREQAFGKFAPRNVDLVFEELFNKSGGFALSMEEAEKMADERILKKIQERNLEADPPSMQIQGGRQDLLGQLVTDKQESDELGQLGSGGGGPMELSKSALESMGFNPENLGRSMQSAMSLDGYQLKLDPTGRVVVQSRVGFPVDPRLQGEVDAQFNDPAREGYQRIRAAIETDPALKKSPSETKNSGTKRGLKTNTSRVQLPAAEGAVPSAAPSTPASSAFARLRAERMAEKAAPKQSRRTAVPPDMSLIGRSFMPSANPLFSLSGARR